MKLEINKRLVKGLFVNFLFGVIVCQTIELSENLNILTKNEEVNITRTPKSVYPGGSVLFICNIVLTTTDIEGNYAINWIRDDEQLFDNYTQTITQESKISNTSEWQKPGLYQVWFNSTLKIQSVGLLDQGNYCCYLSNTVKCAYFTLTQDKSKAKNSGKDIYEASMIALACFMITIIGLFVLFLCNRSYFRRGSPTENPDRRSSDLFNIGAELAAMRHIDKPPTYEQVVSRDRIVRGVPPPSYNELNIDRVASRTGRHREGASGHRHLTRTTAPYWPAERDNSEPAVLEVTSFSGITLVHPGRRGAVRYQRRPRLHHHVELEPTNSGSPRPNNLAGSVNSAFVSDA